MSEEKHNSQIKGNAIVFFYAFLGLMIAVLMMDYGIMETPELLSDYVNVGTGLVFLWACYQVGYYTIGMFEKILTSIIRKVKPKEVNEQ